MRIRERNIIDWQKWFNIVILYKKLDITLWEKWMKNHHVEDPYKLVESLQKNRTIEYVALVAGNIIFSTHILLISFTEQYKGFIVLTTGVLIALVIVLVSNSRRKNPEQSLIYQFREEYERLLRLLNFGTDQRSFTLETFKPKVKFALETLAQSLEFSEDMHGPLSDEAEGQRKLFKEYYNFYTQFGLTEMTYDPYFKKKKQ